MTSTFNEVDHPRAGDGKFATKAHPEAQVSLAPAPVAPELLDDLITARDVSLRAVEQATRQTVELIARVHPSAVRAQFSLHDEGSQPTEVALYDAEGRPVPEHQFDETSLFEGLDSEGLGAMRAVDIDFYNGSADYAIDLERIRAARP